MEITRCPLLHEVKQPIREKSKEEEEEVVEVDAGVLLCQSPSVLLDVRSFRLPIMF